MKSCLDWIARATQFVALCRSHAFTFPYNLHFKYYLWSLETLLTFISFVLFIDMPWNILSYAVLLSCSRLSQVLMYQGMWSLPIYKQKYHILRFLSSVFITALWSQYDILNFIIRNLYVKEPHQENSSELFPAWQSNRIIIKCLENRHEKEEKLMSQNEGPTTAKRPY